MTAAVASPMVTPEEFLEMEAGYELLDGYPVERHVSGSSSDTTLEIAGLLRPHVKQAGLGKVYGPDFGIRIFPNRFRVRFGDLSFVRKDRLPRIDPGFLEVPPDLVVEVVSPSNKAADLRLKVQEWLENGVTEVWVVYPMSREVIVYRNDAATRVFAATDTIESAVLPGFSAPVASLFPSDLPLPAPLS